MLFEFCVYVLAYRHTECVSVPVIRGEHNFMFFVDHLLHHLCESLRERPILLTLASAASGLSIRKKAFRRFDSGCDGKSL